MAVLRSSLRAVVAGALVTSAVLAGTMGTAAAAGSNRQQAIPISAIGFQEDVVVKGPNPRFDVYVPEYPQLRTLHVHAPLHVSPAVDKRSTITVKVGDVPVFTGTIGSLGVNPTVDVDLPLPKTPQQAIPVEISAQLFITGDVCFDVQTNNLYLVVSRDTTITAGVAPLGARPFVTDFLQEYSGKLNLVLPADAPVEQQLKVVQLAYYLHQVTRWRDLELTLSQSPRADTRNIIVHAGGPDLQTSGQNLSVSYDGLGLIQKQLNTFLLSDTVSDAKYDASAMGLPKNTRTLDDLQIGTQTVSGIGALHFVLPFDLASIGGVPDNLRFRMNLTHTPLVSAERAYVNLMVNNTLVRSYDLHPAGGEDDFDISIPPEDLLAANDVRVEPNYFPLRDSCKGSIPQMTATLLNDSNFHWDGITHDVASVGDFLKVANGKVVVSVADPALVPQAFRLLDRLGAVNSAITALDVRVGSDVPRGYDYAILVAAPDKLGAASVPVALDAKQFTLTDPQTKKVVFQADYSQPFGILETGNASSTPLLVESYWRSAAALNGVDRLAPVLLAAQTDDVLIFNSERATYSSMAMHRRKPTTGTAVAASFIPLFAGFGIAALVIAALASRRRRSPERP